MDEISARQPRVVWSFWLACAIAATGGIAPILLAAGGPNRIARVALPFGIAAVALAVNALTYRRGRAFATLLYFVAGIALVYGMLSMVAVPLQLAVLGTCPQPPAPCPAGSERPLSGGESNGLTIALLAGALAILVAFFGLWTMFRARPKLSPAPPPARREATIATPAASVGTTPAALAETAPEAAAPTPTQPQTRPASTAPPPDPVTPSLAPAPKPARKPRVRAPKPQAELAAPVAPLELPASSGPDEPPLEAPSTS
jgi:hypothetical protein